MTRLLAITLAAVGVVIVAGCGIQQVQPLTTPVPTVAVPTPVPTLSVTGGSIAMVVRGTKVPMSQFRDYLNYTYKLSLQNGQAVTPSQAERQALGQLIEYVVALHDATVRGIAPTRHSIDKTIQSYVTRSGGHAKYLAALKQQGLTVALFRFLVDASTAEQALAKRLFPLTKSGPVATARQILIAAKKPLSAAEMLFTRTVTPTQDKCTKKTLSYALAKVEAQSLLNRLRHGAKFSSLVTSCSDDLYSNTKGGFLSGVTGKRVLYPYAEEFAPNIEAAIFRSSKVGSYRLLGSIDGWHIIQVVSRKRQQYPSAVIPNLNTNISSAIQGFHFQSWLNAQAQAAYAHAKIYEHLG